MVAPPASAAPPRPPAARIEPLSAARYKIQFTADESLKEKLERARMLLIHANPTLDLAVLVERAVDLLIADLEKKKLAKTDRPRRARPPKASGTITRATRREVFARDGERCCYVSPEGKRCEARAFLELDHDEPRAKGGSGESFNVRVFCKAHNKLRAEQAFGREHVEAKINLRQRKYSGQIYEKLQCALERCGFRRQHVRKVVDAMREGQGEVPWSAPLEQLLREAILLLTARPAPA